MINETLEQVERNLYTFIWNCKRLVYLYEKIKEIDEDLSQYGLSSPKWRDKSIANTQRGTRIYSDIPLLEIFIKQDNYQKEYDELAAACKRVADKLQTLNDEEVEILSDKIENRYTYVMLGKKYYSNRNSMYNRVQSIYKKLEDQQEK